MAKSTISESMPTRALRDQVVPDTPLAESPLIPKPYAASKDRNLRARLPFDRVVLLLQGAAHSAPTRRVFIRPWPRPDFTPRRQRRRDNHLRLYR
jgi:hypothetical protein